MSVLVPLDDAQHGDVRGADRVGYLAERMARCVRCLDRLAVFLRGGSAPACGALRTGERLHLLVALGDHGAHHSRAALPGVAGDLRDGRAVVESLRLLGDNHLVQGGRAVSGHGGNVPYRDAAVKGAA